MCKSASESPTEESDYEDTGSDRHSPALDVPTGANNEMTQRGQIRELWPDTQQVSPPVSQALVQCDYPALPLKPGINAKRASLGEVPFGSPPTPILERLASRKSCSTPTQTSPLRLVFTPSEDTVSRTAAATTFMLPSQQFMPKWALGIEPLQFHSDNINAEPGIVAEKAARSRPPPGLPPIAVVTRQSQDTTRRDSQGSCSLVASEAITVSKDVLPQQHQLVSPKQANFVTACDVTVTSTDTDTDTDSGSSDMGRKRPRPSVCDCAVHGHGCTDTKGGTATPHSRAKPTATKGSPTAPASSVPPTIILRVAHGGVHQASGMCKLELAAASPQAPHLADLQAGSKTAPPTYMRRRWCTCCIPRMGKRRSPWRFPRSSVLSRWKRGPGATPTYRCDADEDLPALTV
mmetsp:Transcript_34721/g.69148  ORF Transcript_34721/g.69148 Transcript_34721/m.69148 type:complete len:405 (-) Transcript_34721:99-1313(-)